MIIFIFSLRFDEYWRKSVLQLNEQQISNRMKMRQLRKVVLLAFMGVFAISASAQLSGSYTIDPNGSGSSNYTSFSAAVSALNSSGVSGAVTFDVSSGTYSTRIDIGTISGVSATNTVTFRGATGDSTDVKIVASTSDGVVEFDGADYVTLESMTIINNSNAGTAVSLNSDADNNTVKNCYLEVASGYNWTAYYKGVLYIDNSDDNTVQDCRIRGGVNGVMVYSSSSRNTQDNSFYRNHINQQYYRAFWNYYALSTTFNDNLIDTAGYRYSYGIYDYYARNSTILRNKLEWDGTGRYPVYLYYPNNRGTVSSSDTTVFANNMIAHYNNSSDNSYSYLYYPRRVQLYHNSFYNEAGNGYGMYMYYYNPSSSQRDNYGYNNSWHNPTSGRFYSIYCYYVGFWAEFDYNNISGPNSSNLAYWDRGVRTSIAQIKSANSNYNQNSISVNPDYYSKSDLHSLSASMNNAGYRSTGITDDFDGDTRPYTGDSIFVDIGADEYYLPPQDLDVIGITSPLTVSLSSNTITAEFQNRGSDSIVNEIVTVQYSVDSGTTWISEKDTIAGLAPGERYSFSFTQTWTPTRTGDFRVSVRLNPSVPDDPDASDVISIDVCSGLSGTFTVGTATSDFATLADAMDKLKCGLAGHVTFQLAPGTYNDKILLEEVEGASDTTTLTIDGVSPDSVTVSHTGSSLADAATVEILGADYITIKNMTINSGSSTYGTGVRLSDYANYNNVENCVIQAPNATSSYSVGIAIHAQTSTWSGTYAHHNNFKNNEVKGHYYGVVARGADYRGGDVHTNTWQNNHIHDFYYYGVYQYYTDTNTYADNIIEDGRNVYNYGFMSYYTNRDQIIRNEIYDAGYYNMYLYRSNYYRQQGDAMIVNNFVGGVSRQTSTWTGAHGMVAYYAYNLNVWNNTMQVNTTSNPSSSSSIFSYPAAFMAYRANNLDVRNNIMDCPSNVSKGMAFVQQYSTFDYLDNNQYYSNGDNLALDGFSIKTLDDWKSARSGSNDRSFVQAPKYATSGDLHLDKNYAGTRGEDLGVTIDIDLDTRCSFAPSIGADESQAPVSKPRAFIAVDDTVFLNSPITLYNSASALDAAAHNWYVNGNMESTDLHLQWTFKAMGYDTVKLITENCGGVDSFTKIVYVDTPKMKPEPDFVGDKNLISKNGAVKFTDLSSNGPDSFYWAAEPYWVFDASIGIRMRTYAFVNNTDSNTRNPEIAFFYPGNYEVCLTAGNNIGDSTACKKDYVTVKDAVDMCGGKSSSDIAVGNLYDPGGATANYTGYPNYYNCDFTIDPCAQEITLVFNFMDIAGGDYLRVYDGDNNAAPELHSYHPNYSNGLTGSNGASYFKDTLIASSGKAYFEFQTSNWGGAAGFNIEWTSKAATYTAPVAAFSVPDSVCTGISFDALNTSSGTDNKYSWKMSASSFGIDYTDSAISHSYGFAGTYDITLYVENCGGTDSVTHSIVVVDPGKAPTADFSAKVRKPNVGDPIQIRDESSYNSFTCADSWEWTFSPNTIAFAPGYSKNSQHPVVVFQDTGCYDVTLKVGNSAGTNTISKICYFEAITACVPSVANLNTDIGISRVVSGDIDNSSAMADKAYTDYSGTHSTTMQIGGNYDVTVYRSGSEINSLNRAIWIDYNQDGDFDDSLETVATSGPDKNTSETHSFTIPGIANTGATRMRIGVNITNKANRACGPNQFGEFEDYEVIITPDTEAPVVYIVIDKDTIASNATTTHEQCYPWSTPTAFAIDNVDGVLPIKTTVDLVDNSKPGKYEVTYSAEDNTGNIGNGVLEVTVETDDTDPELRLNGSSTVLVDVYSSYTEQGAVAVDTCGVVGGVTISGNVDTAMLGLYTVTYTAVDDAGNMSTATRTVQVVDRVAPEITAFNGDTTVYVEVYNDYIEESVVYSDQYYDQSDLDLTITSNVNTEMVGNYTVDYIVTDPSGNSSQVSTRNVIVGDTTIPDVSLIGADIVTIDVNDRYYDIGINYADNYTSNRNLTITRSGSFVTAFGESGVADELGTYDYTYTVTDAEGNSTSVTREIEVIDRVAPVIKLKGDPVVSVMRWEDYTDAGVDGPTDNYWTGDGVWLDTTNTVNTQSEGTYYVTYTPYDSSGNVGASLTRIVIVGPNSINENALSSSIDIFPNPSNGLVNVRMNLEKAESVRISIVNAVGQEISVVRQGIMPAFNESINLGAYGAGVYMIKFETETETAIKRVTITE